MMLAAKWALYRCAERLSGGGAPVCRTMPRNEGVPAIAVFASTIGELNAIAPFLHSLTELRPANPLVLLSDHAQYRESFLRAYPHARFALVDAHSRTAEDFFRATRCGIFVLAEIPLLPHDAPARLPFAWLREARRAGARTALINGWLYGESPACRMDKLERALFAGDYLRHLDCITVQDSDTRARLINLGAQADTTQVVGNLKFDAACRAVDSPPLFEQRRTIVACSINNAHEVDLTLDAFVKLRHTHADCALVIAPRHPENLERTDVLCAKLAQRRLGIALRSEHRAGVPQDVDCVVLDTFGELNAACAHAACTHVGINHNVLEPLRHGKAVSVCPGWEPRYPSHGVYRLMKERGVIVEADDSEGLATAWRAALGAPARDGGALLAPWAGATQRTLGLWRQMGWL